MMLWIGATVLLLTALGFLLVPAWLRSRRTERVPLTNLVAAALLVPFAAALYLHVTTWSNAPQADSRLPAVEDMVAALADRLQRNPDDPASWRLLGQSYLTIGRYAEALEALEQAWQRTPVPDNDLRVALAEAEALNDRESLAGEAGALFAEALEIDPSNQKALFYGGLAALMTQEPEVARERWSRLLASNPPEHIAEILRQQLGALGGPSKTPAPAAPAAAAGAASVRLMIHVAEGLQARVPAAASLFIFARNPDGGPPVAVLRQAASALPGEFTLSDANAMIPGRSIQDFETLTIVARISLSGQPTEQSGDLFGQITYHPGEDLAVQELLIAETVP